MRRERPPLVIVSGAPGSGKTTLAALLAKRLELPRASAVLVHCEAPPALVVERFRGRAGSAGRHRVHPDLDRLDDLERELVDGTFEPLELDLHTIRVDTSSGYEPPVSDAVDRIRRHVG